MSGEKKIEVRIAAHPLQVAIANLVAERGIESMTLREIGAHVGCQSAQQVQHHLGQLVKYGYLDIIDGTYQLSKKMRFSK